MGGAVQHALALILCACVVNASVVDKDGDEDFELEDGAVHLGSHQLNDFAVEKDGAAGQLSDSDFTLEDSASTTSRNSKIGRQQLHHLKEEQASGRVNNNDGLNLESSDSNEVDFLLDKPVGQITDRGCNHHRPTSRELQSAPQTEAESNRLIHTVTAHGLHGMKAKARKGTRQRRQEHEPRKLLSEPTKPAAKKLRPGLQELDMERIPRPSPPQLQRTPTALNGAHNHSKKHTAAAASTKMKITTTTTKTRSEPKTVESGRDKITALRNVLEADTTTLPLVRKQRHLNNLHALEKDMDALQDSRLTDEQRADLETALNLRLVLLKDMERDLTGYNV